VGAARLGQFPGRRACRSGQGGGWAWGICEVKGRGVEGVFQKREGEHSQAKIYRGKPFLDGKKQDVKGGGIWPEGGLGGGSSISKKDGTHWETSTKKKNFSCASKASGIRRECTFNTRMPRERLAR